MVDRVELILVHQPPQVRKFHRHDPVWSEKDLQASHEIVDVGHVREHVVSDDQIRGSGVADEIAGGLPPEETDDRRHAALHGRFRHVGGGLDAEHGNPLLDEVLEQIAVVRGDLDHARSAVEAKAVGRHVGVVLRVLQPGGRVRREVGVLGENLGRGHVLLELDQEAPLADPDAQRVEGLHPVELVGAEEGLAERGHAEIHERGPERSPTEAAERRRRGRHRSMCVNRRSARVPVRGQPVAQPRPQEQQSSTPCARPEPAFSIVLACRR